MDYDAIDHPESEQEILDHPNFWIRFAASFLDVIIVSLFIAVLFVCFFANKIVADLKAIEAIFLSEDFIVFGYITNACSALYEIIMESSSKQGTIGKMALGIYVGNESGERISVVDAFKRYLAKNFFLLLLMIPALQSLDLMFNFLFIAGCMLAVWDPRKQALHDKIAGTYVFVKK
ncbi:MAG: RDD family protein [Bacteroidetes bacterium]|nr:RDD family protein [Bacteroidota bacterium]